MLVFFSFYKKINKVFPIIFNTFLEPLPPPQCTVLYFSEFCEMKTIQQNSRIITIFGNFETGPIIQIILFCINLLYG